MLGGLNLLSAPGRGPPRAVELHTGSIPVPALQSAPSNPVPAHDAAGSPAAGLVSALRAQASPCGPRRGPCSLVPGQRRQGRREGAGLDEGAATP